jgi:hypothetical protein
MFVLVVVVEVEVWYNTIVHKTQPLKGSVSSFFDGFMHKTQPQSQKQTHLYFFCFLKYFYLKLYFLIYF